MHNNSHYAALSITQNFCARAGQLQMEMRIPRGSAVA
jgi:hypothetical protein